MNTPIKQPFKELLTDFAKYIQKQKNNRSKRSKGINKTTEAVIKKLLPLLYYSK